MPGTAGSIERIVSGLDKPHIYAPADTFAMNVLGEAWRNKHGNDLFSTSGDDSPKPLVLSPLVLAAWEDRGKVLSAASSGQFNWRTIYTALNATTGWAELGGPASWGGVRMAFTSPDSSDSGLLTMYMMGMQFFGSTSGIDVEQITEAGFARWLRELKSRTASSETSTSQLMDEMVLYGPTKWDMVVVNEALVLSQLKAAEDRWRRKLRVLYPATTVWSDHPIAMLNGEWVTELERSAARTLIRFLRTPRIQQMAVRSGFRPADPRVPLKTEDGEEPHKKLVTRGGQLKLPPAAPTPSAAVAKELARVWEDIEVAEYVPPTTADAIEETIDPFKQGKVEESRPAPKKVIKESEVETIDPFKKKVTEEPKEEKSKDEESEAPGLVPIDEPSEPAKDEATSASTKEDMVDPFKKPADEKKSKKEPAKDKESTKKKGKEEETLDPFKQKHTAPKEPEETKTKPSTGEPEETIDPFKKSKPAEETSSEEAPAEEAAEKPSSEEPEKPDVPDDSKPDKDEPKPSTGEPTPGEPSEPEEPTPSETKPDDSKSSDDSSETTPSDEPKPDDSASDDSATGEDKPATEATPGSTDLPSPTQPTPSEPTPSPTPSEPPPSPAPPPTTPAPSPTPAEPSEPEPSEPSPSAPSEPSTPSEEPPKESPSDSEKKEETESKPKNGKDKDKKDSKKAKDTGGGTAGDKDEVIDPFKKK